MEETTMTATLAPPAPASGPPSEVAPAPAFRGFRRPSYTMVPDELFDELLPDLSGAELKTLLFVVRRTFGFKRDADAISLAQMLHGVTTRDGRVLHRGVGLSKPTLLAALRSLQARGILRAARRRSAARGDEPTVYTLRFAERALAPPGSVPGERGDSAPAYAECDSPVVKAFDQGGGQEPSPGGWAKNLSTQQTGPRQTVRQHHPQAPSVHGEGVAGVLAPTSLPDRGAAGAGDDDAFQILVSRGVTSRIARELATTHPAEAIRQQLAWQAYRPAATSPAGALVRAIRDAWPPPAAWLEAQEHAAAVAHQAEAAAQRQAEDDARRREWAAKPPEERIAGRLTFWIQGQRAKRREPTEAEITARRAELLAELAAADGVS
jgi:hypothetical protein